MLQTSSSISVIPGLSILNQGGTPPFGIGQLMKKSTKIKEAIDYKKLNATGIKETNKKVSEEDIIGELSKSMESLTMAEGGVSDNENGESKKVSITEEEKPDVATVRRKMLEE